MNIVYNKYISRLKTSNNIRTINRRIIIIIIIKIRQCKARKFTPCTRAIDFFITMIVLMYVQSPAPCTRAIDFYITMIVFMYVQSPVYPWKWTQYVWSVNMKQPHTKKQQ